ncbi:hypothetical protein LSPA1_57 [Salmonella phage LSPA1]|uniref:Uncharacterized protein n=1 Tax=Salmonella phage LSPA1 TaxID=1540823 RepID=A0A088F853_9CAUD|nr:hypothetical protein LSPA1_57 [Salmonella phage LSPA1]AIM41155.1 hypothetical protein LSPA1_57 [Salmonella phage LSPA1]
MPEITIASLERRIMMLESEKQTLGGQISINGEFQLEAFKLLLVKFKEEEQKLLLSPEFDYGVGDVGNEDFLG